MRRPLPQKEKDIGDRLRQWRSDLLIPRAILARKIGIGNERLASYEAGRAPLKLGVFLKLWTNFALNPEWLATGQGPREMRFEGFDEIAPIQAIDPASRFSDAYEEVLQQIFRGRGDVRLLRAMNFADELADLLKSKMTTAGYSHPEMIEEIRDTLVHDFIATDGIRFGATLARLKLEDMGPSEIIDGEALLAELRNRLKRATAGRGFKTQLAKDFGVTQSTVTQWVTGPAKPSSENTLALLEWVKSAEANAKKEPGRAQTRPSRKTRKSKSTSHEKTKSSPPKG